MTNKELVKTYTARVAIAMQYFFENPDLTNAQVKALFEKNKLAKFIEGLLETYKQSVILKDPKSFDQAVIFVQTCNQMISHH